MDHPPAINRRVRSRLPGPARPAFLGPAAIVLILVSMVSVGAAGCGGSSTHSSAQANNRYIDQVNLAQRDFAAAVRPITAAVTPTSSVRADRSALRRLVGAVRALEVRLNAIAPPSRVASLQRELVAELAGYTHAIERAVHRLASRRPRRVIAARRALLRATRTTGAAIDVTLGALNARLH
ncbi:MAG TPA: hypothetical protein VGY97_02060 [Solirubrobacteraceae bacterium]|nr:hypothetical protein [Solirubrobacteraceae bacterium]